MSEATILLDLVETVRHHPGMVSKTSLAMVAEVLGGNDRCRGPGMTVLSSRWATAGS